MNEQSESTQLLLMVLLALWVATVGYSFTYLFVAAESSGFTRGSERITGFLGWQGLGGMFALAIWNIGRSYPKESGARRISKLPIHMAVLLILVLIGMVVYEFMVNPPN